MTWAFHAVVGWVFFLCSVCDYYRFGSFADAVRCCLRNAAVILLAFTGRATTAASPLPARPRTPGAAFPERLRTTRAACGMAAPALRLRIRSLPASANGLNWYARTDGLTCNAGSDMPLLFFQRCMLDDRQRSAAFWFASLVGF